MPDDGISIEVKGLAELQAKLDALSTKQADRCIRAALRAGAAVEQAAIVERAPVKDTTGGSLPDGALKSDIVVRLIKGARGAFSAIIGPGKLTAHVARWVEYGHRIVRGAKLRKGGKHTGNVPPHPFIRPAYEASRQAVTTAICTTLASEIEKASQTKGNT